MKSLSFETIYKPFLPGEIKSTKCQGSTTGRHQYSSLLQEPHEKSNGGNGLFLLKKNSIL
jgi:hypothetical protein